MAAAVHKLQVVRLIRSQIRNPERIRKTLTALGLGRIDSTVIHKNSATVNGQLQRVLHLVEVTPLKFDSSKASPTGAPFLCDSGLMLGCTEADVLAQVEQRE